MLFPLQNCIFYPKNCVNDDDNYIISTSNIFIRIVKNPPLPPKDARPLPKTPHIMRLHSIVGGRGAALVETTACCTQSYHASSKQAMLAYKNQIVSGRGGKIIGGPGLLRERAMWGCGWGRVAAKERGEAKLKKPSTGK